MRILLAPDSFKGTLAAGSFCDLARDTLVDALPGVEIVACPMADGGEGSARILTEKADGDWHRCPATDPLGRAIEAAWGRLATGEAVIDLASASGLPLIKESELDPRVTTTLGTGQLMKAAMNAGCTRIVVALGGSATVDGGVGALSALGFRFLDGNGHRLSPGGGSLMQLAAIDSSQVSPGVLGTDWILACDVTNPLLGARGAAAIFGPQKGAGPAEVSQLENGLKRFAEISGHDELIEAPGAGAAGGAGFGLAALIGAHLRSGFELVAERTGFDRALSHCDLVITGEGHLDHQSLSGKVVGEVVKRAKRAGKRCLVIVGESELNESDLTGLEGLLCLVGPGVTRDQACRQTGQILTRRLQEWAMLSRI